MVRFLISTSYCIKEIFKKFIGDLNNGQPNIKKCVPFLDLDISLSQGKLTTDLHVKSENRHPY